MAKFDPCLQIAMNHKFGLSEQEAKDLIDDLRKKNAVLKLDSDYELKFKRTVQSMTDEEKRAIQFAKIARLNQININRNIDQMMSNSPNAYGRFSAFMVRQSGSAEEGMLDSIANRQFARRSQYVGEILKSVWKFRGFLSKPTMFGRYVFGRGLFDEIDFQRGLVKEMFDGIGSSGIPAARKMAEKVIEIKRLLVNEAQKMGVNIGWLEDHVTTQFHDSVAIRGVEKNIDDAFIRWSEAIYPLLNKERTFKNPSISAPDIIDPEHIQFLRKVFDNIISQNRTVEEIIPTDFNVGRRSLASKVSQHRQLHFKDGDSWLLYNRDYGHSNPVTAILAGIERFSDDVELMKAMGPNPQATFDRIMKKLNVKGREYTKLVSEFNHISAASFEIHDPTLHKWTTGIQNVQQMARLGGAVISAMTDPFIISFTRSYHGVNFFSSYAGSLKHFYRMATRMGGMDAVKEFGLSLGLGLDGVIGSAASRYAPARSLSQGISAWSDNFFKWNGLNWWTNEWRQGAVYMMAHDLKKATALNWDQLAPRYKDILNNYNITEKDFDLLRNVTPHKYGDADLISPEAIKDFVIQNNLTGKSAKELNELSDKVRFMLLGENTSAVLAPTAKEYAFMARFFGSKDGSVNGTPAAMASKLFWMFRSFALTMVMHQFPRIQQMGLPSVLHLLPMVGIGYGVYNIKSMMAGREPFIPETKEELAEAALIGILQSGIGGIAGEVIGKDWRKYGNSVGEFVLGPVGSSAQDIGEILPAIGEFLFKDGDFKEIPEQMWNAVSNHVPYGNHFALRWGMDYIVDGYMRELLNPGANRRMEKRLKKTNKQDFWLRPSEVVPYGAGL